LLDERVAGYGVMLMACGCVDGEKRVTDEERSLHDEDKQDGGDVDLMGPFEEPILAFRCAYECESKACDGEVDKDWEDGHEEACATGGDGVLVAKDLEECVGDGGEDEREV